MAASNAASALLTSREDRDVAGIVLRVYSRKVLQRITRCNQPMQRFTQDASRSPLHKATCLVPIVSFVYLFNPKLEYGVLIRVR